MFALQKKAEVYILRRNVDGDTWVPHFDCAAWPVEIIAASAGGGCLLLILIALVTTVSALAISDRIKFKAFKRERELLEQQMAEAEKEMAEANNEDDEEARRWFVYTSENPYYNDEEAFHSYQTGDDLAENIELPNMPMMN